MNFYKLQILMMVGLGVFIQAQEVSTREMLQDEYGRMYYYDKALKAKVYEIDGERLVIMDEMEIQTKPKFNNQLDRNYYYFLNKKLLRVYPLFVIALEQYRSLQSEAKTLKGNEKRKLIRQKKNKLAEQYESKLRDLTVSEGRIFAKLMNRATGKTVFTIIKELRGGVSAFFWNVKGNLADIDIKEAYDPHKNREDEYVEGLLKTNWNLGYLKPYHGYKDYAPK